VFPKDERARRIFVRFVRAGLTEITHWGQDGGGKLGLRKRKRGEKKPVATSASAAAVED